MRKAGKILVVDDYEANLRGLGQLLRSAEYSVMSAANGHEALDLARRERPDLVLLDVRMPGISGVDVCRELKRSPDTCLTPVVLISGAQERETILAGLEAGADDFLNKPVDRNELLARVRSLLGLKAYTDELERAESVLFALARSIEGKDPYTASHCERLSEYSEQLGCRIGLSEDDIKALRRAGVVHDIGKVAVPEAIIQKRGKLVPDEWKIMKEHPLVGERICSPLKSFRSVLPIIRYHHEKLDGTGYPDGLKGDQIPITARLLAIVDVYDALATDRPYRRALSPADAFGTMTDEVSKGWWDPRIFAEFRRMLAENAARLQNEERVNEHFISTAC